jgi:predicted DNA-binding transcriptional regulator AlpA
MTNNFAGNHATAGVGIKSLDANSNDTMDRLIRDAQGAEILGCSKATWWRRVADGTLPKPIKIGGMSRWKLSELLDVIDRLAAIQELEDPPAAKTVKSRRTPTAKAGEGQ